MTTTEPHSLQWLLPWFTTLSIRYLGATLGKPGSSTWSYKPQHHESRLQPPLGSTPHQPASHSAPTAFLWRRRHTTFPGRTVSCQTSLQSLQRLWQSRTQFPEELIISYRVITFCHRFAIFSLWRCLSLPCQISSSVYAALLHMVRNLVLWMELSVPAKLGADCAPASVCTAAC